MDAARVHPRGRQTDGNLVTPAVGGDSTKKIAVVVTSECSYPTLRRYPLRLRGGFLALLPDFDFEDVPPPAAAFEEMPAETVFALRSNVKLSPIPVFPEFGSTVTNSHVTTLGETVILKNPKVVSL